MRALFVVMFLAGALRAQPGERALDPLHVSPAGVIVDSQENPVVLSGLNRSGTGSGNADATATSQDYFEQSGLLAADLVRILVNAAWWNNNVQVPIANMGYQAYIDQLIHWAEQAGDYVLIVKDEQFSTPLPCGEDGTNCSTPQSGDLSCPNPPGCAADTTGNFTGAALTFWTAFAEKYAADPAVLYDTWEDMHGIDNNTWSAGQNALIAAIRDNNPQALIFVEDIEANQTFESIVAGTLPDLDWPNIVWNFHLYNGSSGSCREPQSRRAVNWPFNIDPLVSYAQQHGHAAGIMEWGGCNDNAPFNTDITTYAQIRSLALAYFDNTNLITQSDGTNQLTAIGSEVAGAYAALAQGAPVSGNQLSPIAHVADGSNFKTTFILTNVGTLPAPYALQLNNASGSARPPAVSLDMGSLAGTIPAGGSATIQTAGTGDFVGWAQLSTLASVGGSIIYGQQNPHLPTLQEGTATLTASPSRHFFVPFDNTQNAVTALALTSPEGFSPNGVMVTLWYTDGPGETTFLSFTGNHQSFTMPAQFPNSSGQSGVAEFGSVTPLYAVVFRFNPTGAFTALDVVQPGALSPSFTRTLAHAADGKTFKTTVLLTNTATQPAPYLLQFDDAQGNAPSPPVALELGSLTGTIPAEGSVTIRTAGTGPFVGWAELTAPPCVGGSVIYSQPHLTTIQEGTATIVSTGTQHFFLPFDNTSGAVTAMALTNSGASAASLTVTVRYSDGTMETPSFPSLASRNHESFTIPGQFPNASNRSGVVEFVSSSPVYAVAFRFNPTGAFTAFEIVSP
jgi:hypothetical protein